MRITIETPAEGEDDEIIIRCRELDSELMQLIQNMKTRRSSLVGYTDQGMVQLSLKEIYYFESVDNRVFAYCESQVYEVRQKLYELEELYAGSDLLRCSKSVILNVSKIRMICPMFNGRLEARLKNGEKTVISRAYVPELKKKLGMKEAGK